MKLDKDTVIKHQFWFLLGTYVVVWLVAVLWLVFSSGDAIGKSRKAYEEAEKTLSTKSKDPINTKTFLPPWQEFTAKYNAHKYVIWDQAWELQKGIYDWPKDFASKDMTSIKAEFTPDELTHFYRVLYPKQIKDLLDSAPKWLDPVELAGGIQELFKPLELKEAPTREEVWLAQEDYWMKRELLFLVYKTVADQSYMYPVAIDEKKEPKPQGVETRYRYRNQMWELTLNLRKNSKGLLVIGGDSTLKNVQPSMRPQALTSAEGNGIKFNVAQDEVRTRFEVRGEPVRWGTAQPLSMDRDKGRSDFEPLEGIDWDKSAEHPVYLSQGFDQTNCPIRRLDALAVGKQDNRTFVWPLQANDALTNLDAAPEDITKKEPAPTTSAPSGNGGGGNMPKPMDQSGQRLGGGMQGGGMMGGFGGRQSGNPTPNNNIERNRYLQPANKEKEPPNRHVPFAMQLLVEQSHLSDVLLEMANSRLRIQITQVDFRRVRDYVPHVETGGTTAGGGSFVPRMPGGFGMYGGPGAMNRPGSLGGGMKGGMPPPMGGGMGGMPPPMMRGGMKGGGPGGGLRPPVNMPNPGNPTGGSPTGGTAKLAQHQPDDNVIELTVYGIATLYRRPDKTAENPSPTAPVTPPSPPAPVTQQPEQKKPDDKTAEPKKPEEKAVDPKQGKDKPPEKKQPESKEPADKKAEPTAPKSKGDEKR